MPEGSMNVRALVMVGALLARPALAQSPPPLISREPETVYSDAQRAKDALLSLKFVQSLLQPSGNLEGQFARWKIPICPHVAGMAPAAAFVIERRIRDIAQQVGAPLDRRDPCKTNIAIFVTAEPQATSISSAAAAPSAFLLRPRKQIRERAETLPLGGLRGDHRALLASLIRLGGIALATRALDHREADAALVGLDREHRHLDLVADLHDVLRMRDPALDRHA